MLVLLGRNLDDLRVLVLFAELVRVGVLLRLLELVALFVGARRGAVGGRRAHRRSPRACGRLCTPVDARAAATARGRRRAVLWEIAGRRAPEHRQPWRRGPPLRSARASRS